MDIEPSGRAIPFRLAEDARQRLLEGWHAMAAIVANIDRLADAQDDERLVELIWQVRSEFAGFLRTVVD